MLLHSSLVTERDTVSKEKETSLYYQKDGSSRQITLSERVLGGREGWVREKGRYKRLKFVYCLRKI